MEKYLLEYKGGGLKGVVYYERDASEHDIRHVPLTGAADVAGAASVDRSGVCCLPHM